MCEQVIKFCSGSSKLLLFAGSFLTLITGIAIAYIGCTSNALFNDIDPSVAQSKSLFHYFQLAAGLYLILVAFAGSVAAYYENKETIRVLSVLTSLNFVLAFCAIFLVPSKADLNGLFKDRLAEAQKIYDYKDSFNVTTNLIQANRTARALNFDSITEPKLDQPIKSEPLNATVATQIWDRLQQRGCCGFLNATEWQKEGLPKSCCQKSLVQPKDGFWKCPAVDEQHNRGCNEVIELTSVQLLTLLALAALVNLYLATVTGVTTYRTFHYNEASQNAYT